MAEPIVRRDALEKQLTAALATMPEEDAVLHVAGETLCEPNALWSLLAARESLHTASMEFGA